MNLKSMASFLVICAFFAGNFSQAVSLKKVFGVGQADYHRMIYAKTWAWLKAQKGIVGTNKDENNLLSLIDDCLSQVQSFSEALNDKVDINYLRIVLAKDSTQVQLYCPNSLLEKGKKSYAEWIKAKSWFGNFWSWNIEKKIIENFRLIQEAPRQVDLSILEQVQKGFELAPFFFQAGASKRFIFLTPVSGTKKFQVHPFADPNLFVLLDESSKSLEYSTRLLVVEDHPETIKKLVYKLVDEFGIIPDRMFSTQSGLGIVMP